MNAMTEPETEAEESNEYTLDNMGARQHSMMRTIANHEIRGESVPSKRYLAAYEEVGNASGYESVENLRDRGLIRLNPDNPDASPTGQGAVELTYAGVLYIAVTVTDSKGLREWALSHLAENEGTIPLWLRDAISHTERSLLLTLTDGQAM